MAVLLPRMQSTIGYMTESMIFSLLDQWWYSQSILNQSLALYALSAETETVVRSSDPSSESATTALTEETDVSSSEADSGSAIVPLAEQELVVRSSEANSPSASISLAVASQSIVEHHVPVPLAESFQSIDHIIRRDRNSNNIGSDSVEQSEPISSDRLDEHADGLTSGVELRQIETGDQELRTLDGKKVHTNYSVTAIAGDGRCLFRAVAHGSSLRRGDGALNENDQRELADALRNKVADELVTRRSETEWFIEGDFDVYVNSMRQPEVWGGEPELLMLSHVLEMPITVYMADQNKTGGLIAICEYGQDYGSEAPIGVLYHGQGHYEAVQILSDAVAPSKL